MDKLAKLLKKLDQKEREQLLQALAALELGIITGLDLKKLKGVPDIYRMRVGRLRVIFKKVGDEIQILDIGGRNENTYRNF